MSAIIAIILLIVSLSTGNPMFAVAAALFGIAAEIATWERNKSGR